MIVVHTHNIKKDRRTRVGAETRRHHPRREIHSVMLLVSGHYPLSTRCTDRHRDPHPDRAVQQPLQCLHELLCRGTGRVNKVVMVAALHHQEKGVCQVTIPTRVCEAQEEAFVGERMNGTIVPNGANPRASTFDGEEGTKKISDSRGR